MRMNDNYDYDFENETLYVRCDVCCKEEKVPCTEDQYYDFVNGRKVIQDIFPEVSPDVREMFLSGWCGDCFDKMLGFEEDE